MGRLVCLREDQSSTEAWGVCFEMRREVEIVSCGYHVYVGLFLNC